MSQFDDLAPLRDVIAAHGLRAQKSLGQNFLLDQNITDKIVRCCGDVSGLHVLEVGPGPGGLTRSLLRSQVKTLTAVEFDPRAVGALRELETLSQGRLHVLQGDALETDFTAFSPPPRAIIANLPYNIATPLLIGWLRQIRIDPGSYSFMALMFQKEVGERLLAKPGTKAYGRLSVMAQWLCDIKKIMDLPPSAFTPPPKVHSCVLMFTPKKLPAASPHFKTVELLTAAAFSQRRKMIRSSLRDYAEILQGLGIAPELRAEALAVSDFIRIALDSERA